MPFGDALDEVLQRLVPRAVACPQDAARAAAQVLGGAIEIQPAQVVGAATQPTPPRPRTWLRAATEALFSSKGRDGVVEGSSGSQAAIRPARKATSGDGRRDDLSAGERTRILRSLRDEGARLADEDSQVFIGVAPRPSTAFDLDFEDSPIPAPLPSVSPVRLRRAGPMFADQPTRLVSVDPRLLRYDDPSPPTDPILRGPQQEAQSDPTITDPALRAAARSHAADMRDDDFEEEQATTLGPGGRTPAAGHGRGDRTQVDGMVDVDWDLEE